jgi:phage terminase small subunit
MVNLTPKQKVFADKYIETGNGTHSALEAYDTQSPNTAGAIASENLRKPNVREYLESKADVAAGVIFDLCMNAENETVRLNAGKDILDRAGFKPIEESKVSGSVIVLPNELINKNANESPSSTINDSERQS